MYEVNPTTTPEGRARIDKYGSTLDSHNVRLVVERIADYPEVIAAVEALHAASPPRGTHSQDAEPGTAYVVGFLLDHLGRVALIRKNRPAWQSGRLNGIGGHVEDGEADDDAMRREFREETGVDLDGWQPFVRMGFPNGQITFYRRWADPTILDSLRTETDEVVTILNVAEISGALTIPNLAWLVPLAAYTADHYDVIEVEATIAETLTETECDMRHQEPYDFAWCETHDETFPLGGICSIRRAKVERDLHTATARGDVEAEKAARASLALDDRARGRLP